MIYIELFSIWDECQSWKRGAEKGSNLSWVGPLKDENCSFATNLLGKILLKNVKSTKITSLLKINNWKKMNMASDIVNALQRMDYARH